MQKYRGLRAPDDAGGPRQGQNLLVKKKARQSQIVAEAGAPARAPAPAEADEVQRGL